MRVEWDATKDRSNRTKHGLSFQEAQALFECDDDYLVIYDAEHSHEEDRFLAVGPISKGVIVVVYTELADDVVRIVSARMATRGERALYRRHTGRGTR
jgi:uncharacterized DUF497 family protein